MSLTPGTRLGSYEIVAKLGEGGMGEVYRAKDMRLGRSAAIKTLPPEFAQDADRRARFEREAKTLATLNHPHIAQIYGLEDLPSGDGGPASLALVMELVEGEDLAQRIGRGSVPMDEVWPLARQIAEGLEAAHEAGIVHRDLKPANIRVTPDGTVKVLDFGLAKGLASLAQAPDLGLGALGATGNDSPTLTTPALTTRGVILGTASYMAPEQAKGKPVDRRADIWAFGCVLYELLTGRRPFEGEGVPEILGAIIKSEPDWTKLPLATPARVRTLLERCLAKDRTQRLQHIGDARLEFAGVPAEPGAQVPSTAPSRASRTSRTGWMLAAISTAAAAVMGVALMRPSSPTPLAVARFAIPLAEDQQFTNSGRHVLALSPDGSTLVFVANFRLFRRDLATDSVVAIQGSESRGGVLEPTFSPDGQWIAYYSNDDGAIKRIRPDGGGAQVITKASALYGMSWGRTGILYAQRDVGVMRVNPEGDAPEVVIPAKLPQVIASPHEMPAEGWVAFSVTDLDGRERWERGQIAVQHLQTGDRRTLVSSATDSRIAAGRLLYRSRATLYALAIGRDGLAVEGSPEVVVEGVRSPTGSDVNPPTGQYAVAPGALAYIHGNAPDVGLRVLAVADKRGTSQPLRMPPGDYSAPRVAPDGKTVAYVSGAGSDASIWTVPASGGSPPQRLTVGVESRSPVWSADGEWIYFELNRDGTRAIARQRADGSGAIEHVVALSALGEPEVAHPGGTLILYSDCESGGRCHLREWSTTDRTSRPVSEISGSIPLQSSVSPDGRWMAYTTNGVGTRRTVFIEPFAAGGGRFEVPHNVEAAHPLWTSDTTLMYQDFSTLWEVDVTRTTSIAYAQPRVVQRGALVPGVASARRNLDAISGTDTMVVVVPADGQAELPIGADRQVNMVLNWSEILSGGSQGPRR